MSLTSTKTLLERFSCSLVGHGKKIVGHKILLKSLSLLRGKNVKTLLSLSIEKNRLDSKNKVVFAPLQILCKAPIDKKGFGMSFGVGFAHDKDLLEALSSAEELLRKKKLYLLSCFYQSFFINRSSMLNFLEQPASKMCQLCVDKVKVVLETRKVRKGRITHRVPIITNPRRQQGKAISLLIENAGSNKSCWAIGRSPKPLPSAQQSNLPLRAKKSLAEQSSSLSKNYTPLLCCAEGKGSPLLTRKSLNRSPEGAGGLPPGFVRGATCPYGQEDFKERQGTLLTNQRFVSNGFPSKIDGGASAFGFTEALTTNKESVPNYWVSDSVFEKSSASSFALTNRRFASEKGLGQSPLNGKLFSLLAEEFFHSANGKSASVDKKKQLHRFALQNRSSLHFRWW